MKVGRIKSVNVDVEILRLQKALPVEPIEQWRKDNGLDGFSELSKDLCLQIFFPFLLWLTYCETSFRYQKILFQPDVIYW